MNIVNDTMRVFSDALPSGSITEHIIDIAQPVARFVAKPHMHMRIIADFNTPQTVNTHHIIECAQGSSVEYFCLMIGGNHTLKLDVRLMGQDAQVTITGAYALNSSETVRITSTQSHYAPRTKTVLNIKGALAGAAQATYHGTIFVDELACQTQAAQHNTNLLLSAQAQAFSQPTLEVLTNDVQCAHGSAVGQLDEQQIFYLLSRGIALDQARKLLINSFFADIAQQMPFNCNVSERVVSKLFSEEL